MLACILQSVLHRLHVEFESSYDLVRSDQRTTPEISQIRLGIELPTTYHVFQSNISGDSGAREDSSWWSKRLNQIPQLVGWVVPEASLEPATSTSSSSTESSVSVETSSEVIWSRGPVVVSAWRGVLVEWSCWSWVSLWSSPGWRRCSHHSSSWWERVATWGELSSHRRWAVQTVVYWRHSIQIVIHRSHSIRAVTDRSHSTMHSVRWTIKTIRSYRRGTTWNHGRLVEERRGIGFLGLLLQQLLKNRSVE